jgi:hypothetical protein
MSSLKAELASALTQMRSAELQLSRTIAQLDAAGVWSGDDAKKFQSDWSDQVHRPLLVAAAALDVLDFIPLS